MLGFTASVQCQHLDEIGKTKSLHVGVPLEVDAAIQQHLLHAIGIADELRLSERNAASRPDT